MSQCIAIVNPAFGGQRYTSVRKACEYVRRGRAVIEAGGLRFIDAKQRHWGKSQHAYWWNGSSRTHRMHRPGEVRS